MIFKESRIFSRFFHGFSTVFQNVSPYIVHGSPQIIGYSYGPQHL